MKTKIIIGMLLFLAGSCVFADNIVSLVARNQKAAPPKFPLMTTNQFATLQEAAQNGDISAQQKLPAMMISQMQTVYRPLAKTGWLLFSTHKLVSGYDDALNNYAVNLDGFFEGTAGQVQIKKNGYSVTTTNGTVFQVKFPEYKKVSADVSLLKDGRTCWVALADLNAPDRRFVENALRDEIFKSSGEFDISSVDSDPEESDSSAGEQVSGVSRDTGEKVQGSFSSSVTKGVARKIVLENNGALPLENLMVEYQSFAEQTIMKMPKDFPSDYRIVGCFEVKTLGPGEKKELLLNLPNTVKAKQETIESGNYVFYQPIPADRNQQSDGRTGGIWVRVHRFTPYGEKLTREYKSAGVPDVEWNNVAPVSADIR